jgi:hypothetical protein
MKLHVAEVTLTLDTSAYTANDVLAATQEITNAFSAPGAKAILQTLTVLDQDDQAAAAMDFYFMSENVALGTENAAVSIADADAAKVQGVVPIATGDWKDLINSKLACIKNIGLVLTPTASSRSLWIAATTAGTPTQTAAGITLRLGFQWED